MKIMGARLVSTSLLLMSALYNCGPSRQETMTREAYQALNRIQAAIEVGVNYQKYMDVVVEAKATLINIVQEIEDPIIKDHIDFAIASYADVSTAWNAKIRGESYVHISPKQGDLSLVSEDVSDKVMQVDLYMQGVWELAKSRVEAIGRLMKRKGWSLY